VSTLDCLRAEELISARLDRALSAPESAELEAHLAGCEQCRQAAAGHAELAAGLEAAFRAEPLRRPASLKPHPRRRWFRLAAAAAILLIAGSAAVWRSRQQPPPDRSPDLITAPVTLASGTTVIPAGPARLELLGTQGPVNDVIRISAGEILVQAARAGPGRTAVRVETPLGTIETLGTVFRVKLVGSGAEGEDVMKLRKLVPLAALLLVGVDEGQVLVRGDAGSAVVLAGEAVEVGPGKVAVGAAGQILKGKVVKVEEGKDGAKSATLSVGKADGVREGFEFTCKDKGWTGKVVSVGEGGAVLEVKGEVAAGDLVETKLTTVLADKPALADPNPKPEPAPVKVEAVEGLTLTLLNKEMVQTYKILVDKDGKPIRDRVMVVVGGANPAPAKPEGAEEKVQEYKYQALVAQLKNITDKPIVLGFATASTGFGMASPIKLAGKDAEGKELAAQDFMRIPRADDGAKAEDKPAAVTILKPGQVLEQEWRWVPIRFPAEGKYTVWATLEEEPKPEVLPGFKPWSGKLKSNEVEWENKGNRGWGRGREGRGGERERGGERGGGPGQPRVAPQPEPAPGGKEVF
jgi:hypothetical protein